MTIENQTVALARLHPHPANYKKHPQRQINRLCWSLRKFGQPRSIVVQARADGDFWIVAGHGVVLAAQAEEWESIRADVLPVDWEPERVKAYLAADNELARMGENDNEALADILEEARNFDYELLAAIGYDDDEFGELLAEIGRDAGMGDVGEDPGADVSKADELQAVWQVQPGDLWQLGDHRLICGDCTDAATVARVMGGEKANCTVTDPPYGVGVEYGEFDDTIENVKALISGFMPTLPTPAALTPGVPAMWHYPPPAWVGAWVHPASTSSGPWGFVGANPILYYGKDPYLSAGKGRRDSSFVAVADRKGEDDHPVAKPLNVWLWLIERMTPNAGAIVYEPFSGSGTTIVACEQLGRKCRAVELHPPYVAVALQRWTDMTGRTPERIE